MSCSVMAISYPRLAKNLIPPRAAVVTCTVSNHWQRLIPWWVHDRFVVGGVSR
jgi:hypothetical protein